MDIALINSQWLWLPVKKNHVSQNSSMDGEELRAPAQTAKPLIDDSYWEGNHSFQDMWLLVGVPCSMLHAPVGGPATMHI